MKHLILTAFIMMALTGCSSDNSSPGAVTTDAWDFATSSLINHINQDGVKLDIQGTLIADLGQSSEVVSPYGSVKSGTTLNLLTYQDVEFLVYGEDGVFAAECEASSLDSSYGPTHPLCEVAHAESFDTIIICFANAAGASLMDAQNWPGTLNAFDSEKGMICYKNGVKLKSKHVFTY